MVNRTQSIEVVLTFRIILSEEVKILLILFIPNSEINSKCLVLRNHFFVVELEVIKTSRY